MRAFWLGRELLLTTARRRFDRKRAEKALGKPLQSSQPVHHHSITQLVICESRDYHWLLHRRERVLRLGGNPNTEQICWSCNSLRRIVDCQNDKCAYCLAAHRLWWILTTMDCSTYGAEYERIPPVYAPEPTWNGKTREELDW